MTDFTGSGAVGLVGGVVNTAMLLAVAVADVRSRRIPNRLLVVLAAAGLLFSVLSTPIPSSVGNSLLAGLIGFGIWIPFYALRMIGAGDVKLFAAAGLWLLPLQVVQAAVVAALVGGALSLVGMVVGYGTGLTLLRLAHGLRQPETLMTRNGRVEGKTLPYGVAMVVGLALVGWAPWLFGG
jgi:prepilin peptidase CpaA